MTVPLGSADGSIHTTDIMIVDDSIVEDTESFNVSVSVLDNDAQFVPGLDEATVYIMDNDGKNWF